MRALTVRQPWAYAILHLGKVIENRTWATAYRGPLALHAGSSRLEFAGLDPAAWWERYGALWPGPDGLVFGALVGVVELIDCVPLGRAPASPWAEGPWCWLLANPQPLAAPVPWRGQQGLWNVPDRIVSGPAGGPRG